MGKKGKGLVKEGTYGKGPQAWTTGWGLTVEVGEGLGDGAKGKIIGTLDNIKIKKNPVARKNVTIQMNTPSTCFIS